MNGILRGILNGLRNIAPARAVSAYHFFLSYLGALWYGFPSRRMTVIGVTGTKGKTTTANLIFFVLEAGGFKTGLASTVNFRIGEREWVNETKQTMLGRFALQKLLREMADAGCTHAVVETSSEGILQHRHRFIDYRAAVFTNLSPEHIERHGGFENYRAAKVKLFAQVARRADGVGVGVYNCDDENISWFLAPPVAKKYGFSLAAPKSPDEGESSGSAIAACPVDATVRVSGVALHADKSEFSADGTRYETPLIGEFNVRNAAAAIALGTALGIPAERMREGLARAKAPAGRMEVVHGKMPFTVIVDYSYEPKSLESALRAVRVFKPSRVIALTGSAGGGRDTWRRPVMGETAAKFADIVIATTDDPYDEDPETIVDEVLAGAEKNPRMALGQNLFRITDRRKAIEKAVALAKPGDVVLIAGKGGERWMNVRGGKIPWDDVKVAEEALRGRG